MLCLLLQPWKAFAEMYVSKYIKLSALLLHILEPNPIKGLAGHIESGVLTSDCTLECLQINLPNSSV